MSPFIQDVRYGWRILRGSPGFTLTAVFSLALGIGGNAAVFSLVNAVLLKALPFHEPDRLVMVWEDAASFGFPQNTPAPANYADWKAQCRVFDDMAAIGWGSFNLTGDGEPLKLEAHAVTEDFLSLLGVRPALGRGFLPDEDKPGASKVALISHALWQNRFGGARETIGGEILLNGEKHTVVGVMPPRFQFLEPYIDLWVPLRLTARELAVRDSHYLTVVARLKPEVTLEQAQTDVKTVMRRIAQDHPREAGKLGAFVQPLRDQLAGEVRRPLIVLLVAIGCVLLISCANVANLLLSRSAVRTREIALRAALGAGRGSICRQLLTESLLLAGAGCAVGLALAHLSLEFLKQLIPPGLSLSARLALDADALVFGIFVSLLAAVIFGLAPALQAAKIDLDEALKQNSGRSGFGKGNRRLQGAVVVAEVALALVLLVGAGLLIQTFLELRGQYSGLRPENLLTVRTTLARSKYAEAGRRIAFYDQVLERVKGLPEVVSAGYTTSVPLEWKGGTNSFTIEGRPPDPSLTTDANYRQISAGYLKTMGIPLCAGRFFDDGDNARSPPVAIVNETMARQYWPNENALGKRFKLGDQDSRAPWLSIVGIAGDVRQMGVDAPVKAEMYFPYRQVSGSVWAAPRDLVVRTAGDPRSIVPGVREAIRAVDPDQPLANIRTMDEILGEEVQQRRLGTTLLAVFAGLALLLASLGIHGVISYFVVQRTQEIGVRIAVGAERSDIVALVLGRGMGLALVGVAAGLAASYVLTRWISSLLFGISESDPVTFAAVAALLLLVALVACLVPARRALSVDPIRALRCE